MAKQAQAAGEQPQDDDPSPGDAGVQIGADDYREAFGEEITDTLDFANWTSGDSLAAALDRTQQEVEEAIAAEDQHVSTIRKYIFEAIKTWPGAAEGAGLYTASQSVLESVTRGLLMPGRVEACDGTRAVHDTLALTIVQIGICLVSYDGQHNSWGTRLFHRDLRLRGGDPLEEMIELLKRRDQRGGINQPTKREVLTDMAQRGIMTWAERACLTHQSTAPWRMGHGNPADHLLITSSGLPHLMWLATRDIRELVEGHRQFIFVPSEPADRVLLTIGNALRPLEYTVVDTVYPQVARAIEGGTEGGRSYRMRVPAGIDNRWDGQRLSTEEWICKFRDVVAPQIVRGVYRASRWAPAQMFYAHRDCVHEAVHIAMADSILQEHRGFPMLIDLANSMCTSVFGGDSLTGPVEAAYARAGAAWRYQIERMSRRA